MWAKLLETSQRDVEQRNDWKKDLYAWMLKLSHESCKIVWKVMNEVIPRDVWI